MPYVEAALENEAMFTVRDAEGTRQRVIPTITGRATLGEHVANTLNAQPLPTGKTAAGVPPTRLFDRSSNSCSRRPAIWAPSS